MSSPPEANALTDANAASATSAARPRHRVLLVDDDESILRALVRLLRREPYDLETASGADEALRILEARSADLVMSDQRMPGRTGVELLREVRHRWPATIRVILSGYTKVNTIIDAINDGEVYKYLTKPWNDEELKLNLRRALEQYELEGENRRLAEQVFEQNKKLMELNRMLEERAQDAGAGLNSWQMLLETLRVGVVAIDENGLVVAANRRGIEMTAAAPEFVGNLADIALRPEVYALIERTGPVAGENSHGRLNLDGRSCQWDIAPLQDGEQSMGSVVSIWEEVP
jgi:DNA-binding response OmpR family regulator